MPETTKPNSNNLSYVAVPHAAHECAVGWDKIAAQLKAAITKSRTGRPVLVVECYPGVDESSVMRELQTRLNPELIIHAAEAYHSPERIDKLVAPFIGGDHPAFGRPCPLSLVTFFDAEPLWRFRRTIDELKDGLVLIVGCGASLIAWGTILVHVGLTRREAQQRIKQDDTHNLGASNQALSANLKHKRALFVDWPIADRWKRPLIKRWDSVLDTHHPHEPKLAHAEDVRLGLQTAVKQPFHVIPHFDSRPRDGQEAGKESNSLRFITEHSSFQLGFGDLRFELPVLDLVFNQPHALLGEAVHARFGDEVPIRMDFAATMTRGNFEPLIRGDGWRQERTVSTENRFAEIRRHWFGKPAPHHTHGSVNVLHLAQGDEAIVSSPTGAFEPLVVRHAETLIVPAAVGRYNLRPHDTSVGKELVTLKAFVSPLTTALRR